MKKVDRIMNFQRAVKFLLGVASIAVLLTLGVTSCDKEDRVMRVREQVAHYAAVSPSEGVWAAEMRVFLMNEGRTYGFLESQYSGGQLHLDFFQRYNNWFVAIASKRNDSIGVYQRTVGFYVDAFRNPILRFRRIQPAMVTIRGDSLRRYVELFYRDSIWSLIGQHGFWGNDTTLADLYANATIRKLSDGSVELLNLQQRVRERSEYEIRILNLDFLSPNDRALSIGELRLNNLWQDDSAKFDSVTSPKSRVEFGHGFDEWYAIVISNRTDSAGEFRPIIGHRAGDSLEYRYAGNGDYQLTSARMQASR